MITFVDGPAKGQRLELSRTPIMLRVTRSESGEWDALDQPDDEPRDDEYIFLYRMHTSFGSYHVRMSDGTGGWRGQASYQLHQEQPPDDVLRERDKWNAWCEAREESIRAMGVIRT